MMMNISPDQRTVAAVDYIQDRDGEGSAALLIKDWKISPFLAACFAGMGNLLGGSSSLLLDHLRYREESADEVAVSIHIIDTTWGNNPQ